MLELQDIQGIVLEGYGKLQHAAFILLAIEDPKRAGAWLASRTLRTAADKVVAASTNVALTCAGLAELGLKPPMLAQFPSEFLDGMVSDFRRRILGDIAESSPENWQWGGPHNPTIHVLLMLYEQDATALRALVKRAEEEWTQGGLSQVELLDTNWLPDFKEHFGFRDGISGVSIAGYDNDPRAVPAGEFLLGYPNVYGKYTRSPVIDAELDPKNVLARAERGADLGRNGSYLVFRQLEQDVFKFWEWVDSQAHGDAARRSWIASKMVGRWPGGAPLTVYDSAEPVYERDTLTKPFLYAEKDPHGQRCPLGSHVRRMNPRDALGTAFKAGDETLANAHRLIRRGRAYGKPLATDMRPESFLAKGSDNVKRGLHFICLNANIERQFEFVQQTWANSSKFSGLRNDPDPLIGARALPSSAFTVQERGIRHRYVDMPSFVKARGGAYFFLPSVRAVKYLGSRAASANG